MDCGLRVVCSSGLRVVGCGLWVTGRGLWAYGLRIVVYGLMGYGSWLMGLWVTGRGLWAYGLRVVGYGLWVMGCAWVYGVWLMGYGLGFWTRASTWVGCNVPRMSYWLANENLRVMKFACAYATITSQSVTDPCSLALRSPFISAIISIGYVYFRERPFLVQFVSWKHWRNVIVAFCRASSACLCHPRAPALLT